VASVPQPCPECGTTTAIEPKLDWDTQPDLNRSRMPVSRKVWFIQWHETKPGEACITTYTSKRSAERAHDGWSKR
jgi:hypothetical protein